MNAPLAMIALGTFLANGELRDIFTDIRLYKVSAVRLLLIPLMTILMLKLFPEGEMRMAILIAAAAPIGSNVAVYAEINGCDYSYAAKIVCLSTLLSIVTMPLIVLISSN